MRLLLLALLLSLAAPTSPAQAGEFWQTKDENEAKYDQLMREADELAELASSIQRKSFKVGSDLGRRHEWRDQARRLAEHALNRYESAAVAMPASEEPHYRAGEVLLAFFVSDNIAPPSSLDRAIEHWNQFQKKAPLDPRLNSIVNDRAIALTKRGTRKNQLLAVEDYSYSLALIDQSSDLMRVEVARLLSNRAELQMMLGNLKQAIDGYERAIEAMPDTVYGYGLAVALDRDKQGARARDVAQLYAETDGRNALNREGTFFVPSAERHYYAAMRHEGRRDYRAAIEAFEDFVRLLPTSPWAERAHANIKRLTPKAAKQSQVKPQRSLIRWR